MVVVEVVVVMVGVIVVEDVEVVVEIVVVLAVVVVEGDVIGLFLSVVLDVSGNSVVVEFLLSSSRRLLIQILSKYFFNKSELGKFD